MNSLWEILLSGLSKRHPVLCVYVLLHFSDKFLSIPMQKTNKYTYMYAYDNNLSKYDIISSYSFCLGYCYEDGLFSC